MATTITKSFTFDIPKKVLADNLRQALNKLNCRVKSSNSLADTISIKLSPRVFEKSILNVSVISQGNEKTELLFSGQLGSCTDWYGKLVLFGMMNQIFYHLKPDEDPISKAGSGYGSKLPFLILASSEPAWPDICSCCCGTSTTYEIKEVDIPYLRDDQRSFHNFVKYKIPICDMCKFHRDENLEVLNNYGTRDVFPSCIHHLKGSTVAIHQVKMDYISPTMTIKNKIQYVFKNLDYTKAFSKLNNAAEPTVWIGIGCGTISDFLKAVVDRDRSAVMHLQLNQMKELEEALTEELIQRGKTSKEIMDLLFTNLKAFCPHCGKQFSNETLHYLSSSFYNVEDVKGFQCKDCEDILKDFIVQWMLIKL